MEQQKSIDLLNFLKEERIILSVSGCYPIARNKYRKLQYILAACIGFFSVVRSLFGCIEIIHNMSDLPLVARTGCFILPEFAIVGKTINIILQKKNLLAMEDLLQDPLFMELEFVEEKKTIYEGLKFSRLLRKMYFVQVVVCLLCQFSLIRVRGLPLDIWFPFDEYNHYYTIFFIEIFVSSTSATTCIAIDFLLTSALDLCSAQFSLLNNRLLEIGSTLGGERISDEVILQKLKKYIKHHNHIYRFTDLIQKTFSIGLFLEILSIASILCLCAFSVLVTPIKSTEFVMLVLYIQCIFCEIAVHCWFGQKLLNAWHLNIFYPLLCCLENTFSNTVRQIICVFENFKDILPIKIPIRNVESEQVTNSCYLSKWQECSVEVQKHILMIMRRANRNVVISAAGMFPLNLQSLMNVMSSAYSLFAIICQFYDEGDKDNTK